MVRPRYQDIEGSDIAEVIDDDGTRVRIIVGEFWGKRGPVEGIAASPIYLDVSVPAGIEKRLPVDTHASAFAYVFQGSGSFEYASEPVGVRVEKEYRGDEVNIRDMSGNRSLIRFDSGDEVFVQAGAEGVRFLLVTGRPIREPIAWQGPIVMNTREELVRAFSELNNGQFIKPSH